MMNLQYMQYMHVLVLQGLLFMAADVYSVTNHSVATQRIIFTSQLALYLATNTTKGMLSH